MGINVAIGATVGLGGGLMGSRASDNLGNLLPTREVAPILDLSVPIRSNELNQINFSFFERDKGGAVLDLNGTEAYHWRRGGDFVDEYHNEDILVVHGSRKSMEFYPTISTHETQMRPLSLENTVKFIKIKGIDGTNDIRLFSCYSGRRTLFYSRAQMLADELNTNVYAFRTSETTAYDGPWKMFSPRNR